MTTPTTAATEAWQEYLNHRVKLISVRQEAAEQAELAGRAPCRDRAHAAGCPGGCEVPAPEPAPTFTPYYRSGGTDNFKWHRAAACGTREEAIATVASLRRAGHAALYQETALLDSLGLPETFEAAHGTGWW